MGSFWHDLRHGVRLLSRNRGISLIALLTLALGIGGSTAIFSVVDGILLRPLPYPHPDRIVRVFAVTPHSSRAPFNDPDYLDFRSQIQAFDGVAEYHNDLEPVLGASEPVLVTVAAVSQDFFRVMGVRPYLGPGFPYAELHVGGAPIAMISYGFWQRYLGAAPDFAAHHLSLAGHAITLVGVMPPGFSFPNQADMWFPREIFPFTDCRVCHGYDLIARLKPGVSLASAQAQTSTVARRLKQRFGQQMDMSDATLVPLHEVIVGDTRPALLILLGAVGLLLLVACANVANLLLAQAAGRQRELAVRLAIGASRRHLARQFILETFLLSLAGSLLGVPLGLWGVHILIARAPEHLPRAHQVGLNWVVLGFAAGLAILTAVAIGALTALRATGRDVQESLRGGERTQTGGSSSYRLRMILMGAQVAVTLVLLVGAGLLGRSLMNLLDVNPGFHANQVVTMHLMNLWPDTQQEKEQLAQSMTALVTRLRAIPGIQRVGLVSELPLSGIAFREGYLVVNSPKPFDNEDQLKQAYRSQLSDPTRSGVGYYHVADGDYFRIMGIPLLRGRLFSPADTAEGQQVAVVSQSFAEKQWPGQDPLGKLVELSNMYFDLRAFTVIGVVGDVRERSLDASVTRAFYAYYRQRTSNDYFIVMQSALPAAGVIIAARQIEREMHPEWPPQFRTMDQLVSASISDREFNLTTLAAFAIIALLVALMGVYGVASYLVAQRTKEIGVRVALGADAASVVRLIAGEGLRVILIGAAVGLAGALAITQVLTSLLYGVHARDPLTLAAVVVLVLLTGLAACYVPARRAAQVDPIITLRDQ